VDRWELCQRDLKWLCVKTNNRSWLLYRYLWEKSSNDLKYIAVLFDDKKWLHLCNIWNSVPLSIKLRAISLKDPTICQPTLREIILNDDDVYKNNTISALSEILNITNLENNYLISQSNHRRSNNNLRYTDHTYKHFTRKNNLEIFPERIQIMKGDTLEGLLAGNINCKENANRNSVTTDGKMSKMKPIDESNNSKDEKHDGKKTQKEDANPIEKTNLTIPLKDVSKSFVKPKNIENNGYIRKKNHVPLKFIEKYKNKNPMEQKIFTKKSKTDVILNNKNDLTRENTIGKIPKMNESKSGFNSKLILKKSSETNIYKNDIVVKAGVDKDAMKIESLDKQNATINKTIKETIPEKITEANNNIISEVVKNNILKKSVKPLGGKILKKFNTGSKVANMNNDVSLIEKQNVDFSKFEKIAKKSIPLSVKNLTKVKEKFFKKKSISLKKENPEKNMRSSEVRGSGNSDTTNNNINTQKKMENETWSMFVTSVTGHLTDQKFDDKYKNWNNTDPHELFDAKITIYIDKDKKPIENNLKKYSKDCNVLILWLDCDREGEHICFEVINACSVTNKKLKIHRAQFSAVTEKDIKYAINNLKSPNKNLAQSVDVRREIDLRMGSIFTRFMTIRYFKLVQNDTKIISYGPCQFPTLGFVVNRYLQIKNFNNEYYWTIKMGYLYQDKDGNNSNIFLDNIGKNKKGREKKKKKKGKKKKNCSDYYSSDDDENNSYGRDNRPDSSNTNYIVDFTWSRLKLFDHLGVVLIYEDLLKNPLYSKLHLENIYVKELNVRNDHIKKTQESINKIENDIDELTIKKNELYKEYQIICKEINMKNKELSEQMSILSLYKKELNDTEHNYLNKLSNTNKSKHMNQERKLYISNLDIISDEILRRVMTG
ncbi:conserved Plasmodium protein, unknown function, partial [Plasmodium ovale curtisi]